VYEPLAEVAGHFEIYAIFTHQVLVLSVCKVTTII